MFKLKYVININCIGLKALEENLNTKQKNMDEVDVEVKETATSKSAYVSRGPDRRRNSERRDDPREAGGMSLTAWLKSLLKPRVGVDRRKGLDRRRDKDQPSPSAELTPEELKNLLD